jgi:hypothetical protein
LVVPVPERSYRPPELGEIVEIPNGYLPLISRLRAATNSDSERSSLVDAAAGTAPSR